MTFAVGGLVGMTRWIGHGERMGTLRQPPGVWAIGLGGLFGYHALYFAALKLAPPAEAGLVNYLWPLLIVLFSATLPSERLRAVHLVGALMGFTGVAVLVAGADALRLRAEHAAGLACAFAAAFVWAGYSVASRRAAAVPTDAVTGFCLATAGLGLLCHLAWEQTVWPADALAWGAVLAAGLGPVGGAFYLWDVGCKKGDLRLLGVASYAIPVASTGILVLAGYARATPALAVACVLIAAGAGVATMRASRRRRAPSAGLTNRSRTSSNRS